MQVQPKNGTFYDGTAVGNISSRPEDRQALEAFLQSPDRQLWDLVRLSEEAREAARAEMAEAGWC